MKFTITEGLAEIKTLNKRIEKARKFVLDHLFLRGLDPMIKDGGMRAQVDKTTQQANDLAARLVDIKMAINGVNMETDLSIDGQTLTIAKWLIWRREVSAGIGVFQAQLIARINQVRQEVKKEDLNLSDSIQSVEDVAMHINEVQLQEQIDQHEKIMGELDGKLSMLNATTDISHHMS